MGSKPKAQYCNTKFVLQTETQTNTQTKTTRQNNMKGDSSATTTPQAQPNFWTKVKGFDIKAWTTETTTKTHDYMGSPKFQSYNNKMHEYYQKSREQAGGFAVTDNGRS